MAVRRTHSSLGIQQTGGASSGTPDRGNGSRIRTTLVLSSTLDRNLELYCLTQGIQKGQVMEAALTEYLTAKGMQPDKAPRIKVSW